MRRFGDVRFLFLDDFDASLHYRTAEKVLRCIVDRDDVQAVLTTQNTSLLRNNLLRPDCCLYMDG